MAAAHEPNGGSTPEAATSRTVIGAVVDAAIAEGMDRLFSLMGDGNQDLIIEAVRRGIPNVHVRHEQNAVAMADGYSRFSDKIGFCTVTEGPGVSNTATSLLAARAHPSPVLLFAAATSRGDYHHVQRFDQPGFIGITAGAGITVEGVRGLDAALGTAFSTLHHKRSPFVLDLPIDVQAEALPDGWQYTRRHDVATRVRPARDAVRSCVELLRSAHCIGIVCGQGAVHAGAHQAIRELADLLDASIATTLVAKGFCAGHPLHAGVTGGLGKGLATELLTECDVILAIGASMNAWTTHFGDVGRHAKVIQIDADPAAPGRFTAVDAAMQGDARAAVEDIVEQLGAAGVSARVVDAARRRRIAAYEQPVDYDDGDFVDPRRFLQQLDRALPAERIYVAAGGHCGYLACQLLTVSSERNWNYTIDFGALGHGLATAIGAAFARPGERVTHVTGDGELMMQVSELHTAVLHQLPLTVVVLNDRGFGQERHSLVHKGLPTEQAMTPSPDFARLADSLGATGHRFDRVDQLVDLPRLLRDARGVIVLDVRINGEVESSVSKEIMTHLK
jgi:acetolactate synthase-1/2/3 large subunit